MSTKVEGAVTVQPLAEEVRGFKDYFLKLRPSTNTRNPWFAEYWEVRWLFMLIRQIVIINLILKYEDKVYHYIKEMTKV